MLFLYIGFLYLIDTGVRLFLPLSKSGKSYELLDFRDISFCLIIYI